MPTMDRLGKVRGSTLTLYVKAPRQAMPKLTLLVFESLS